MKYLRKEWHRLQEAHEQVAADYQSKTRFAGSESEARSKLIRTSFSL